MTIQPSFMCLLPVLGLALNKKVMNYKLTITFPKSSSVCYLITVTWLPVSNINLVLQSHTPTQIPKIHRIFLSVFTYEHKTHNKKQRWNQLKETNATVFKCYCRNMNRHKQASSLTAHHCLCYLIKISLWLLGWACTHLSNHSGFLARKKKEILPIIHTTQMEKLLSIST